MSWSGCNILWKFSTHLFHEKNAFIPIIQNNTFHSNILKPAPKRFYNKVWEVYFYSQAHGAIWATEFWGIQLLTPQLRTSRRQDGIFIDDCNKLRAIIDSKQVSHGCEHNSNPIRVLHSQDRLSTVSKHCDKKPQKNSINLLREKSRNLNENIE